MEENLETLKNLTTQIAEKSKILNLPYLIKSQFGGSQNVIEIEKGVCYQGNSNISDD